MARSAEIGSLRVALGLDSAQFAAGAAKAQGSLSKLSGAFKAFAAGAVAALSVGGITKAFSSISEHMDTLGKSAQKIGIPVEELSKLEYAARLADVPLEALQTSIGKLSKGLSEFQATGKGDAGAALRAIGVSALTANGQLKPTNNIIAEIADKFAGFRDGANKTALAMALFGKSGADMIPLLNQGSEAIGQAEDEADRFGITVTESSAVAAEQFNDNLTRLAAAGQGLAQVVAVPLIGALADLVDKVLSYIDVGSSAEGITNSIYDAFSQLGAGIRSSSAEISKIVAIYGAAKDIFTGDNLGPLGPVGRWNQLKSQIAGINSELSKANSSAQQFSNPFGKGNREGGTKQPDAPNFNDVLAADEAHKKALAEAAMRAKKAQSEYNAKVREAMGVLDGLKGPVLQYQDNIKKLNFLLAEGKITQAQYNQAVIDLRKNFADIKEPVNELADAVSTTLQGEFKSWIDSALSGTFKLKDALSGLISKLAQLGVDNFFNALISGGGNPLYGGGGLGDFFKGLLGFARGGTIMPGGSGGIDSQLVAFRKSPNERVDITKPGQRLTAGGTTVNLTQNINAMGEASMARVARRETETGLRTVIGGESKRNLERDLRFG